MKTRIALFTLMGAAALTLVGASWPLNPLVTRVSQPNGPVPVGCEESLAPANTPRIDVASIPEREIVPVSLEAPPSRTLRDELDAAHRALARNDRPAFDEHLREAREIVATYPPGGERSRAEEVLWALNDAAIVWDAQFESPFFDETSEAYTRASRYAGYTESVRRGTLTDDSNRRFYPASESREFITRVAGERLERLGIRNASPSPSRSTSLSTSRSPSTSTSPSRHRPTTRIARAETAAPPAESRSQSRSHRRATPRKSRKPAALAKSAPSSAPAPAAAPAPAEPAPTAPPAPEPAASPAVSEVPPPSTDSATTTAAPVTTSPVTTSSATPSPEPADTTPAVTPEHRSVVVPALLILIGLGVLIVLFRASR